MLKFARAGLLCAVVIAMLTPAVYADVVFLKNKNVYEGVVKEKNEDFVLLEKDGLEIKIPTDLLDESAWPGGIRKMDKIPWFKVMHIMFDLDQEARAREVLNKLNKGEKFTEMAEAFSTDRAEALGNMGYIKPGQASVNITMAGGDPVPEVEHAAFAMYPGNTSGIIESRFGLHIVKVDDARYQDRETLEFFDADGKALALEDIKVKLYQVEQDERGEKLKLGKKIFGAFESTFEDKKSVDLEVKEETRPAPANTSAVYKESFNVVSQVAVVSDIIRVSWRIETPRGMEIESGLVTFNKDEDLEKKAGEIAVAIYNALPKMVKPQLTADKEASGEAGPEPPAEPEEEKEAGGPPPGMVPQGLPPGMGRQK